MTVETEYLLSGSDPDYKYLARPTGTVGSVGWAPYPWHIVFGATPEDARAKFIEEHKTHIVKAKLKGDIR